jgi:hypothetical protein
VLGVKAKGHRRARAERGAKEIIGIRTGIESADRDRLVGTQPVASRVDVLRELAVSGLDDANARHALLPGGLDVARHPRREDFGGVSGVLLFRQQVIGVVERNEALRVLRGREDLCRVGDLDDRIVRRMHDEQGFPKLADVLRRVVALEVFEEIFANAERTSADVDRRFAFRLELFLVGDEVLDVARIVRRAERRYGTRFGYAARRREHCRTAEAVSDEDLRRAVVFLEVIGSAHDVFDVRRERRVGEIAAARAKPGEIEAQHRDAARRERLPDVSRGFRLLRAREAVREDRVSARRAGRQLEPCRELVTAGCRDA